jgi:hypothetical protein
MQIQVLALISMMYIHLQVSTTGLYTFNAAGSSMEILMRYYYTAPFDPLNPCTNYIVAK